MTRRRQALRPNGLRTSAVGEGRSRATIRGLPFAPIAKCLGLLRCRLRQMRDEPKLLLNAFGDPRMWFFPGDQELIEVRDNMPIALYPDTERLVARNDIWGLVGCVLRIRICEQDRNQGCHEEESTDMFRALPGALLTTTHLDQRPGKNISLHSAIHCHAPSIRTSVAPTYLAKSSRPIDLGAATENSVRSLEAEKAWTLGKLTSARPSYGVVAFQS